MLGLRVGRSHTVRIISHKNDNSFVEEILLLQLIWLVRLV